MHKKPLISIVTPVYNQARYIDQTIHGVMNQTHQNWEWVILDDGSTDNTGEIIGKIKDTRIRYSVQEHAGYEHLTETFNNALALCSGDFIALLDGDDYWPENKKLEVQIQSFSDPDIVLSYGESCVTNQNGEKIGYMRIPDNTHIACNNPVGSSLNVLLRERYSFLPNSTVLIKKEALTAIGGFVEAAGLAQDYPTWTRLSLEGGFSPIPLLLGYWRRHIASSDLRYNPEHRFDAGIDFLKNFVRIYGEKLRSLGFLHDMKALEKHWEEHRREHFRYLPYNRAMLMLRLGLFEDAKIEFKKFRELNPSAKSDIIYALINVSRALEIDVVNPLAEFKSKF